MLCKTWIYVAPNPKNDMSNVLAVMIDDTVNAFSQWAWWDSNAGWFKCSSCEVHIVFRRIFTASLQNDPAQKHSCKSVTVNTAALRWSLLLDLLFKPLLLSIKSGYFMTAASLVGVSSVYCRQIAAPAIICFFKETISFSVWGVKKKEIYLNHNEASLKVTSHQTMSVFEVCYLISVSWTDPRSGGFSPTYLLVFCVYVESLLPSCPPVVYCSHISCIYYEFIFLLLFV